MRIIYRREFENQLLDIINYIAKDKVDVGLNFANELEKRLSLLPANPFQCRQSVYFDNKNIRDLIYKGYTIHYKINLSKDTIEILRIFNRNKPLS